MNNLRIKKVTIFSSTDDKGTTYKAIIEARGETHNLYFTAPISYMQATRVSMLPGQEILKTERFEVYGDKGNQLERSKPRLVIKDNPIKLYGSEKWYPLITVTQIGFVCGQWYIKGINKVTRQLFHINFDPAANRCLTRLEVGEDLEFRVDANGSIELLSMNEDGCSVLYVLD